MGLSNAHFLSSIFFSSNCTRRSSQNGNADCCGIIRIKVQMKIENILVKYYIKQIYESKYDIIIVDG